MTSQPIKRIALLMPVKDGARYLSSALDSVAAQILNSEVQVLAAYTPSSDDTLEILERYDFVQVVSTIDDGLYDGVNRALRACDADLVGLLNSDDRIPDGALATVRDAAQFNRKSSWVSGGAAFLGENLDISRKFHKHPLTPEGALFGIPVINTRFFRRSAFNDLGNFRTDIGLAADKEFIYRMAMSGLSGVCIPEPTYQYRHHEGSQTMANSRESLQRVSDAEWALANSLMPNAADDAKQNVRRFMNFCRLRRFRHGNWELAGLSPIHTVTALRLWHRWRGNLSGY